MGIYSIFPLGDNPATPTNQAWCIIFPHNTGIFPTKELLCEILQFLMSCNLSTLLTYVHPSINALLHKSPHWCLRIKMWTKIFLLSQNYLLTVVFFQNLSAWSQQACGIINHGTMLAKETLWGHLMGTWGAMRRIFGGPWWQQLGMSLSVFFFSAFFRNSCQRV